VKLCVAALQKAPFSGGSFATGCVVCKCLVTSDAGQGRVPMPYAVHMKELVDSFWRAAAYCLHPKVILLSLLP